MAKDKLSPKSALKKKTVSPLAALRVMNAMPDPVIAFDSMLKVSFSNKSAQAFFRLEEGLFLDKYMVELLGNKNTVFEAVEDAVRKNQTVTLQKVSVNGKPVGSVIIAVVEKGLYMMIIRQKPMKPDHEIGDPSVRSLKSPQVLAEELKIPLAEIHRAAEKLGKSKLNAKDKALSSLILREATRVQSLLEEFNVFQETPPNQHKDLSLRDVHNHVAKIALETYGNKIQIDEYFDPSLPDIRGSFDHLVQAKMNLIKNAVEASTQRDAKISIRTFYDEAAAIDPAREQKLPLCIEIEDNGRGITPEVLNRIFQPYFTTKKNSRGLGLPITSKIVYEHGGTINVNSAPGKTVFRINLPMPIKPLKK